MRCASKRDRIFRMNEEEFLDAFGVGSYLKDVTTLLLENRPDDAIGFVNDYFKNVAQGSSEIVRAFRCVPLNSFYALSLGTSVCPHSMSGTAQSPWTTSSLHTWLCPCITLSRERILLSFFGCSASNYHKVSFHDRCAIGSDKIALRLECTDLLVEPWERADESRSSVSFDEFIAGTRRTLAFVGLSEPPLSDSAVEA